MTPPERKMDVGTLRSFIVMAESESVSQAARKLYVAQSALSKKLKALETECGVTLIERDHHNFRLTESGKIMYARALKIVELADAAVADARGADTAAGGTLNVAVTPSLATGVLRDVLKVFTEQHPDVTVRIYEAATPALLARLEDGTCDVALVRTPYTGSPAYEVDIIHNDRMVVLSAETLPSTLDYAELLSMPLILTHRYTTMLARIAERQGLTLRAPVQCDEIATCIALAETGIGATMIPFSTFANHRRHGMTLHHALLSDGECDTRCELVRLKNRRLSAAARAFADTVLPGKK